MNKFVTTALALTAAGSLSYADPGDNEWLELDGEINSLASALQPSSQDGMGWAVLLRFTYTYSTDDIATGLTPGADDISGFKFEDVRLAFWGSVAEYGYRVSMDLEPGGGEGGSNADFVVLDAFGYWDCEGYVTAKAGQFKAHTMRSAMVYPENLLFIDRTAIGASMDWWVPGIQAFGTYEAFSYWVSIQNERTGEDVDVGFGTLGGNGQESDHFWSARAEWDFNAGAGEVDGARGGNDELNFTVGANIQKDDTNPARGLVPSSSDTLVYALDVAGNFSSFGFFGEVAFIDDDAVYYSSADFGRGAGFPVVLGNDATPWTLMGSFLINPEWEVGVRYENLDNDEFFGVANSGPDNTIISLVAVWYRSGSNAKWTAQWSDYDADTGFEDGSLFQIGLTLGASN